MAYDTKLNGLPTSIPTRYSVAQVVNEVAQTTLPAPYGWGGQKVIPADGLVECAFGFVRGKTNTIKVNNATYSQMTQMTAADQGLLQDLQYIVDYESGRLIFATTEAGKSITEATHESYGVIFRPEIIEDLIQSVKDIRDSQKPMFDAVAANPKLQIVQSAASLDLLRLAYPPSQYSGSFASVGSTGYRCNGVDWIPIEEVGAGDPIPVVIGVSPANGQVSVALAANVELVFDDNMDGDTVLAGFTLKDKNGVTVAGSARYYDRVNAEITADPLVVKLRTKKFVFDPTADLTIADSPYTIELLPALNNGGQPMAATFSTTFSCAADILPTACVIAVNNIDGDSADVAITTQGSDYETAQADLRYTVQLRDVTAGGSFAAVAGMTGLAASAFPKTVGSLALTNNYEIRVLTIDGAAQSSPSNTVPFQTSGITNATPSEPVISKVSDGDGTTTIRIDTLSTDAEDGTITIYRAFADGVDRGVDINLTAAGQTYQFTGLSNGTSPLLTLKAKDSQGSLSPASNAVTGSPSANPAPVSTISFVGSPTASQAVVKGTISGIGAGDSVASIEIALCQTAGEIADPATVPTARRWTLSAGADLTAFQSVNGYTKTGLSLVGGTSETPAVRVTENKSGGGTQTGQWSTGAAANVSSYLVDDSFNNLSLDTAVFGAAVSGSGTAVEGSSGLTLTSPANTDGAIGYRKKGWTRGSDSVTITHSFQVSQVVSGNLYPMWLAHRDTDPVVMGSDLGTYIASMIFSGSSLQSYYYDTAGVAVPVGSAISNPSLNTTYQAEMTLTSTNIRIRILAADGSQLSDSGQIALSNLKAGTGSLRFWWGDVINTNFAGTMVSKRYTEM